MYQMMASPGCGLMLKVVLLRENLAKTDGGYPDR
jgi:hypothetical protein